jgi:uncharacterized OB-fold protein
MVVPRPVPLPDERSQPFWDAARRHTLVIQRCENCGWLSYPPDVICANCLSPDRSFRWATMSGRGTLRSWTVVRTAFLPGFAPYTPYVVAVVELDEQPGLRVAARLVDGPEALLGYGATTETIFDEVAADVTIPMFRLVAS